MQPSVGIFIVTYNGSHYIQKCLDSILASDYENFHVYILDNHSTDHTPKLLEEYAQNPRVSINLHDENLGFGKANNLLMEQYSSLYEYSFLLNQDVYIQKDTLSKTLDFVTEYPQFALYAPIQTYLDGTTDAAFNNYIKHSKEFDSYYQCSFVNAAAWFLPYTTLQQVGGFSPEFPHYGEDKNYCDRLVYHQLDICILKQIHVIHDRQQSHTTAKKYTLTTLLIKTIFVNPNYSAFQSIYRSLGAILGSIKHYILLQKDYSYIRYIPLLLKDELMFMLNQSQWEKKKRSFR